MVLLVFLPRAQTAAECTPLSLSRLIRLACLSAGDLVGGGDVGATRESYLATAPVRLLTVTHAQVRPIATSNEVGGYDEKSSAFQVSGTRACTSGLGVSIHMAGDV